VKQKTSYTRVLLHPGVTMGQRDLVKDDPSHLIIFALDNELFAQGPLR